MNKTKMTTKKKNAWRENIEAILIAIVIAMFIRTFIVQAFKIPSGSMLETLQIPQIVGIYSAVQVAKY